MILSMSCILQYYPFRSKSQSIGIVLFSSLCYNNKIIYPPTENPIKGAKNK